MKLALLLLNIEDFRERERGFGMFGGNVAKKKEKQKEHTPAAVSLSLPPSPLHARLLQAPAERWFNTMLYSPEGPGPESDTGPLNTHIKSAHPISLVKTDHIPSPFWQRGLYLFAIWTERSPNPSVGGFV